MKYALLFMFFLTFSSCKKYEEIDFQAVKCSNPTGTIESKSLGTLRYAFDLKYDVNDKTELIRIFWKIDGNTFTGSNVSYQFDKKGAHSIEVTYYNKCLTQGKTTINLDVK